MTAQNRAHARTIGGVFAVVDTVWRFFSSLKLAVVLLILIGLGSIVGTFFPQIPQNPGLTWSELESLHAPAVFFWLVFFQVFDLFHSWWFSLLMVALALNLIACSMPRIARLGKTLKRAGTTPSPMATTIRRDKSACGDVQKLLAVIKPMLGRPRSRHVDAGEWHVWEKGRFSRLGFLAIHLGFVLVLAGGAVGEATGMEGSLALQPGETGSRIRLHDAASGNATHDLPFGIRCADFRLERYGATMAGIKDYVADLEVIDGGQVVMSRQVEVNHPLSYGGFSFYQSSYQQAPHLARAILRVESESEPRQVRVGQEITSDPAGNVYSLRGFRDDFNGLGEAVQIAERKASGQQRTFWLLARYPGFAKANRAQGLGMDLLSYKPGYATVLGVSRDPGTNLVWVGCLLLMVGLVVVFFGRHRRLWLKETDQGVQIACWSHRGQSGFVQTVESRICKLDSKGKGQATE